MIKMRLKRIFIALVLILSVLSFVACVDDNDNSGDGGETVDIAVSGVKLNKQSLELKEGASETLTVSVFPDNATDKMVIWTSDAENVATVSAGTVTAIAEGSATITASAGGKSATCSVTVKPAVSVWNGSYDLSWYSSDPEKTEYLLSESSQLAGFAKLVNDGNNFSGITVSIENDMNFAGKEWTPIGQKGAKIFFEGTFDGNGKTLSGLSIRGDYSDESTFDGYVALFGAVRGAVVKNVTVSGVAFGKNAAGIVARADKGTVIENCRNGVDVTGTPDGKCGGIVCLTNPDGTAVTVKNCVNTGTVKGGKAGVGGIVAYGNANTKLENCTNGGAVGTNQDRYAGGIIGYATGASSVIDGCKNVSAVAADGNAGGIAGAVTGNWTIENCINEGSVTGTDNAVAGGIAGSLNDGAVRLCENTAAVHGIYAGGIIGVINQGEIVNCSGGKGKITSPAFTLGFNGHAFKLALEKNETAGRILGANGGGGPSDWTKITLADCDDDYTGVSAVGICGPYTTWANLEIVSGTFRGEPLAGNRTYIKLNDGAVWNGKESGKYECGGLDGSRKTEWTKIA